MVAGVIERMIACVSLADGGPGVHGGGLQLTVCS